MKLFTIANLTLALCVCPIFADELGWLEITSTPKLWTDSLLLSNKSQAVLVLDSPTQSEVRGFIHDSPFKQVATELEIRAQVTEFSKLLLQQPRDEIRLNINFFTSGETISDFKRLAHPYNGSVLSSYRIGKITLKRTIIASQDDDVIFIHLHANQPGALSFRVTLSSSQPIESRIEDRRQMILSGGSLSARVWVIPFESDVATEENSITVLGEGEALIVLNLTAKNCSPQELAATWTRLADRYVPGENPANPARVWERVLENYKKN